MYSDNPSTSKWMGLAFDLAEEALQAQEVPVGCVIVKVDQHGDEVLIGKGRNRVNETRNATAHAEMVAIDEISQLADQSNDVIESIISKATIYVTVEPCIMCADALHQLKVARIVYGCSNERFGGMGSVVDVFMEDQRINKDPVTVEVEAGVGKEKAIALLRRFYAGENKNAPNPRIKNSRDGKQNCKQIEQHAELSDK